MWCCCPHNHYDHLDLATLSRLAAAHPARVITPLGNDSIIRAHDWAIRVEPYDWGDRVALSSYVGVTLQALAEAHSKAGIAPERFRTLAPGEIWEM